MIRILRNSSRFLVASILPTDPRSYDIISKDVKSAKSFERREEIPETGLDRMKRMFELDELGAISPELNSIYQAGFLGMLVGVVYGGVITSRKAYIDFMENNEATAFKSHLDAKRKLQDRVTVSFAKGGIRWGWRLALFTTSYTAIVTFVSVYREKSSIYEYLAAGGVTGALYKVNLGLRGMFAGGVIGGFLGLVAGGISLLILKVSGSSIEEVRYWQYKWKLHRDEEVRKAMQIPEDQKPELMKAHDQLVGKDINLDKVK